MQMGFGNVAFDADEVVEPFPPLGVFRPLGRRQQPIELEGAGAGVDHFVLRLARMDGFAKDGHLDFGGVEGLVSDFVGIAPVDGVGVFGSELLRVEVVGPPADFLIGGEAEANRVMLDFRMGDEIVEDGHDDGDPGFVIGP